MHENVLEAPACCEEENAYARAPRWKRAMFSEVLLTRTRSQKIAYIGVMAALCIAVNLFEFKFADVQFSLTMFMSMLTGILLGPVPGLVAVSVGDFLGYVVNSWGLPYYWWVALSVAMMALLSGFFIKLPFRFRGALYCKLALICASVLLLCSVAINTTGMYYIGLKLYTSKSVLEAFSKYFGGEQTYWGYVFIRFFAMGQIFNSLFNYALFFLAVPVLNTVKPLKLNVR